MTDPQSTAIDIIKAEHRALGAVVNNMRDLLDEVQAKRTSLDFKLLWSMIYYIDAFPDRLHHPKEEEWLFRLLRLRSTVADDLMNALEAQHENETVALGTIRRELGNTEAGVPGSFEALRGLVSAYAEYTWKHLRAEERELMPIAVEHLSPSDWKDIADAFLQNEDPLAHKSDMQELDTLFHDIVRLTPAPLGLGVARG